jgi:hypothetical protein
MQQDPFTQSAEARLTALRHQLRSADRTIRGEQLRAVPDIGMVQTLTAERQRLAGEIARYEGILRSLPRRVSPAGAPDRRGA